MLNDPLITAIRKSDDDAIIVQLDDTTCQVTSSLFHHVEPIQVEPIKEAEPDRRLADVPIRVLRTIFACHAIFSLACMLFSYIFYYILRYDYARPAAIFTAIASGVAMVLFYILLLIIVVKRGYKTYHALVIGILYSFYFAVIVLSGATTAILHNLLPLQMATVSFAQCLAIYTYTLESPQMIDVIPSIVWMSLAFIIVFLFNLYGIIIQGAWVSAGLLWMYAALSITYLSLQIVHADRYCLSENDLIQGLVQFYLDPALLVIKTWRPLPDMRHLL